MDHHSLLNADTLTEEKLWRIAGTRDLGSVAHLELVIDSSRQTVDNLGELVPGLHTLSLDGSNLCSLRDLGTALDKLHTLSLNASKVKELDGISALPALRELRLADNDVPNLTPLCMHESLQVGRAVTKTVGASTSPTASPTASTTSAAPPSPKPSYAPITPPRHHHDLTPSLDPDPRPSRQ